MQAQAERLDQIIFAGFTHRPAEELAAKLVAITPADLTRVFFSDSGSTAVEVALKMALGYWAHKGRTRRGVVALEHAYHGDTFGAMSVGARGAFNAPYEPFLFDVHRLPFPGKSHEHLTIEAFETLLRTEAQRDRGADRRAARARRRRHDDVRSPIRLRALHDLCRRYGIIFIADEVMTGWGRTGTRFACDQASVAPDILCLSKGLTGGFLPMGVTLATEEIYQAFYSADRAKTFFHSSSFTGNPLACAAACASLQIWEDEPVVERIGRIAQDLAELSPRLQRRADVENVRQTGTILALDVRAAEAGYLSAVSPKLYRLFHCVRRAAASDRAVDLCAAALLRLARGPRICRRAYRKRARRACRRRALRLGPHCSPPSDHRHRAREARGSPLFNPAAPRMVAPSNEYRTIVRYPNKPSGTCGKVRNAGKEGESHGCRQ